MDENQLMSLAKEHLVPLFSGAEIDSEVQGSTTRQGQVASENPCCILFKASQQDRYRLALRRSQPFDGDAGGRVNEKRIVQAFVDVATEIEGGLTQPYKADLLSTFQRRVVVKAICEPSAQASFLEAIDQLSIWATRLYEGKPIAATFGFVPGQTGGRVNLHDICEKDFSAVLSNGFDTMFTFDFSGRLIGLEPLSQPNPVPSFAPYRQGAVASWSSNGRISLVLNRLGEILVFKDAKLLFARRSGRWHFLTHEPVLTQMGRPDSRRVRNAIYESALDSSFARTGACIGIVTSGHQRNWQSVVPKHDDHLERPSSCKALALSKIVGGKRFQEIDRRLRQELLAIDGATLVDYLGNVLAVGAILQIAGGSTGGGRLAAAKTLAKFGVGIKVSQDGGILGYHDEDEKPKFAIM